MHPKTVAEHCIFCILLECWSSDTLGFFKVELQQHLIFWDNLRVKFLLLGIHVHDWKHLHCSWGQNPEIMSNSPHMSYNYPSVLLRSLHHPLKFERTCTSFTPVHCTVVKHIYIYMYTHTYIHDWNSGFWLQGTWTKLTELAPHMLLTVA